MPASAAANKTSSLKSLDLEEEENLVRHKMDDETTERKTNDGEAARTLYDAEYWKRAMRTGCMIMVLTSVVSLENLLYVAHISHHYSYLGYH